MLGQALSKNAASKNPHSATDAEDRRLIDLVARGDRVSFEVLYRSYFPRLTRFLYKMSLSPELLEEIVNDTMLIVWKKAAAFDHSCKLSTWIFAIGYRQGLKAFHQRDKTVDIDTYLDSEPKRDTRAVNERDCPEAALGQRQTQQRIRKALIMLSVEQRTVVALTYYHGIAYDDIAAIMECPVNTVKTRMFHARHRLKVLLADLGESTS